MLKYMEICSAPSYGLALLLSMVLLCSFLWYRIWKIPSLVCGPFQIFHEKNRFHEKVHIS